MLSDHIDDEAEAEPPRRPLRTAIVAVLLTAAFAGLAVGASVLLRPWAGDASAMAKAAPAPVPAVVQPAVRVASQPAATSPRPEAVPPADGPRVAILLTDVAAAPSAALPAAIGLAFSPYTPNARALAGAARAAGHEVWAGVPMQPKAWPKVSPGPNTLLTAASPADNRRRLDWALTRVGPAAGVVGIMGSAFTEDAAALDRVLGALAPGGLAYLDSRVSPRSVALARARRAGVRAVANDRFLDGDIAANLAALTAAAKANGAAVGVARAGPGATAAIAAWAPTLARRGVTLVPPATLAR